MDNQQKKRILSQYLEIKKEIVQIQEQYNELRSSLESAKAQRITDMPKGLKVFDTIGENICKLDDYYNKHSDLVDKYLYIEKLISKLENPIQRTVMRLRYIKGYRWENICVEVNYSWKQTHRMHTYALRNIEI